MTHTSIGTSATESGSRYLQQLCKHWSHKAEVSFTPEQGTIAFPSGETVSLTAQADALELTVTVPDDGDLAHFQDVVDRHIKRFAFREDLEISWR